MLGLSLLMISDIRYPSFKKVGWKTRGTLPAIVISVLLLYVTVQFRYVMPVVLFSLYLVYGMIRPWLSQKMRKEIEVETDEETPVPGNDSSRPPNHD
jgi:CDP-diacylglycerol--serine O-phosphatidyltransferase